MYIVGFVLVCVFWSLAAAALALCCPGCFLSTGQVTRLMGRSEASLETVLRRAYALFGTMQIFF